MEEVRRKRIENAIFQMGRREQGGFKWGAITSSSIIQP